MRTHVCCAAWWAKATPTQHMFLSGETFLVPAWYLNCTLPPASNRFRGCVHCSWNPKMYDVDEMSMCSASLQAFDLGQWALARRVLEMGLRCNPRHQLMLQRLAEVLVLLGDWAPAREVLNRLLEQVGLQPTAGPPAQWDCPLASFPSAQLHLAMPSIGCGATAEGWWCTWPVGSSQRSQGALEEQPSGQVLTQLLRLVAGTAACCCCRIRVQQEGRECSTALCSWVRGRNLLPAGQGAPDSLP